MTRTLICAAALSFAAIATGCKDAPREAPPGPPPPPAARPGACSGGGAQPKDTATAAYFPRTVAGFCLDPNSPEKNFGEGAQQPIESIRDLFDGECEIYLGFNVRRVTELRYVDGAGSPATIDVHLSKFASPEEAYAMFTKRTLGDGDPAEDATATPASGGGEAAMGHGNAYLWRGNFVAELTYNDETAGEAGLEAAGARLLPPLLSALGAKLPGDLAPLAAVAALPKEGRLPLGTRYAVKDALGIAGLGAAALGYYREGAHRYRVAVLARADEERAKEALAVLAKRGGAAKEKAFSQGGVRLPLLEEGIPTEWFFARAGNLVIGMGDEPRALKQGMSDEQRSKVSLAREDKSARLQKLVVR